MPCEFLIIFDSAGLNNVSSVLASKLRPPSSSSAVVEQRIRLSPPMSDVYEEASFGVGVVITDEYGWFVGPLSKKFQANGTLFVRKLWLLEK